MDDFETLHRAYLLARAQRKLQDAREPQRDHIRDFDVETDRLSAEHTEALHRLVLRPAQNAREIAVKLDIIVTEDLYDGWYRAAEIMATVRCDAERLLR